MNTYRAEFFARCPVNAARIHHHWTLTTVEVVRVETINDALDAHPQGFHEDIADDLHRRFGGTQALIADHHGVTIETARGGRAARPCGCAGRGFEFCNCP